jgi:hypothetical protein
MYTRGTLRDMERDNIHIKMAAPLADAIRRYAKGHGITFTAALSVLATRGLRDEGLFIEQEES